MATLNDWLIGCAAEYRRQAWDYAILANHYDFPSAGTRGLTCAAAVEKAKAAWEHWYLHADKRNAGAPGAIVGAS